MMARARESVDARSTESVVQTLLPILRQFCLSEYGIALGGSLAKGIGDAQSDLDLYLFTERVLPKDRRGELVEQAVGPGAQVVSWGRDEPFEQGGTDFWYGGYKVEVWLRNSRLVEETIAACRDGNIRRDWVRWTVMGFFNYVVLSDVHVMEIVQDPHGILADWKRDVGVYPDPLRQAIVDRFLPEAKFWPDNFHYHTAIERADVIYICGIVQQVLQALIQVVFALNDMYFPGEKKLAETLGQLSIQPCDFVRRVQDLLYPGRAVSVEDLWEQRRELVSLVAEVEQLWETRVVHVSKG